MSAVTYNDYKDYTKNINTRPYDARHMEPNISLPPMKDHTPYPDTCTQYKFIAIDSRDFPTTHTKITADDDDTKWVSFTVPIDQKVSNLNSLEDNYRSIRSIQLSECIVPDFTADWPYLTLEITLLRNIIGGTNERLRNAFAILIPERRNGSFVTCKINWKLCFKEFEPPMGTLPNLEIKLYTPDKDLVEWELTEHVFIMLCLCMEIPQKRPAIMPQFWRTT